MRQSRTYGSVGVLGEQSPRSTQPVNSRTPPLRAAAFAGLCCLIVDSESDGDVDVRDFGIFQATFDRE